MRLSHQPHRGSQLSFHARRANGERGYVLVTFAFLLIPLTLMAALAVDVGNWYSRISNVQKAADAAALAGVVWLPDVTKATTYAKEAAKRNGYENGVNGVTITVTQVSETRLRVSITDPNVQATWAGKLGVAPINITRKATAEYVLPVPLGSPENRLGNDPLASPVYQPNLWASISAPYTAKNNGDPFSTKCLGSTSGTSCGNGNTEYRNWGYLYIIDVPQAVVGQTLNVQLYDAGNYARSNYPNVETADNGTVNTQFELFDPDPTPLDSFDGLNSTYSKDGDCTSGPGRLYIADGASSSTYKNKWTSLCSFTVTQKGFYIVQVKTSNIPGVTDAGNGWNQFSIKAVASGSTQPTLYTTGDLSLFNNLPGLSGTFSSTFYLADIQPKHAGKTMIVSLFDPGDGASGTYYVNVLGPGGTTTSCSYLKRGAGGSATALNPCSIQTRTSSGNIYDGSWLDITINIPTNYSCTTDCWWKVRYDFQNVSNGSGPNDRTVWSARVIGDPVHLVQE